MINRTVCGAGILAGFFMFGSASHADNLLTGSADAGKTKSATCAACHGPDGNSANPEWPSLAGQHSLYIHNQLAAFKAGQRENVLMSSQAMILDDQDMKDLALYFEAQAIKPKAVADPDTISRGEQLYRGGDRAKGVPACAACHGPSGRGNPAAAYPKIAGQFATYAAATLRAYATGARESDANKVMRTIASALSEDDIVAVSSYIQGLQ